MAGQAARSDQAQATGATPAETPPGETSPAETPPAEWEVALDLLRRAALISPAVLAVAAAGWGLDGAASAAFGLVLVALNFLASAALVARAAAVSLKFLGVAVLAGYPLRLGMVVGALFAVRDLPWVEMVPLGLTVVAAHLGLLVWEARHVSVSLAFPGLKPGHEAARKRKGR